MQANNTINRTSRERGNYYSLLNMSKRIIHLAGLDGHDGDTVLSVAACLNYTGETEARISQAKIGSRLSIPTANTKATKATKATLEKAASRRLKRLARGQTRIGRILIGKVAGPWNQETQRNESSIFTDHLTPAAQAARAAFIRDTKKPEWRKLTSEEKRARFDHHAQAALESLPVPQKKEAEGNIEAKKNPLSVTEYLIHFERTIGGSLEKGFDKMVNTYKDPGAALSSLERLQAEVLKLKHSLYKQCPELRKDITISSFPAAEGPQDGEGAPGERGEMVNTLGHEPSPISDIMGETPPAKSAKNKGLRPLNSEVFQTWAHRYLQRFGAVLVNYGLTSEGACTCSKGNDCQSAGKHPWGGSKNVIRSGEELSKALKKVDNPNLGLPTGRETGITVLDFDGPAGRALFEEWEAEGLILPDMLRASTGGGGVHVVIEHIPGLSAKVKTLPGLDIRNEGGQIVTAPSLHRSGNLYTWQNWPGEILPAPAALIDKLKTPAILPQEAATEPRQPRPFGQGRSFPAPAAGIIPKGQRNDKVFRHVCGLVGEGYSIDRIRTAALAFNDQLCSPPLPESEIEAIVRSASSRYSANPEAVKGGRI
jgi:hypothetical protein